LAAITAAIMSASTFEIDLNAASDYMSVQATGLTPAQYDDLLAQTFTSMQSRLDYVTTTMAQATELVKLVKRGPWTDLQKDAFCMKINARINATSVKTRRSSQTCEGWESFLTQGYVDELQQPNKSFLSLFSATYSMAEQIELYFPAEKTIAKMTATIMVIAGFHDMDDLQTHDMYVELKQFIHARSKTKQVTRPGGGSILDAFPATPAGLSSIELTRFYPDLAAQPVSLSRETDSSIRALASRIVCRGNSRRLADAARNGARHRDVRSRSAGPRRRSSCDAFSDGGSDSDDRTRIVSPRSASSGHGSLESYSRHRALTNFRPSLGDERLRRSHVAERVVNAGVASSALAGSDDQRFAITNGSLLALPATASVDAPNAPTDAGSSLVVPGNATVAGLSDQEARLQAAIDAAHADKHTTKPVIKRPASALGEASGSRPSMPKACSEGGTVECNRPSMPKAGTEGEKVEYRGFVINERPWNCCWRYYASKHVSPTGVALDNTITYATSSRADGFAKVLSTIDLRIANVK